MVTEAMDLAETVNAMRPMVPAKDFELSQRFYAELGFRPRMINERLIEMHLGAYSFILQNYYFADWAGNFVMHMLVSDIDRWWDRMRAVASRYDVKAIAPQRDDWGATATIVDPSGVLWRIAKPNARRAAN
jgi:hypothetical protein